MTSWLRRLSRDRSSKDHGDLPMPSRPMPHNVDSSPTQPYKDTQYSSDFNSQDKLQTYRPATAGEPSYSQMHPAPLQTTHDPEPRGRSMDPAPDPLTKAFNDAIRPYKEEIEDLRGQVEDAAYRLQTLEDERADMHAWIDKRGLRADVPPSISSAMNVDPAAAATLNYQLDRKMTVLNHDLHRLQDSVSTHLPTATFASTLAQLIPPVEELSRLPGGSPLAFELLIKLGGNLNSHGGDEGWNNDADSASRADFYARLDECMMDVVKMRLKDSDSATGNGGVGGTHPEDAPHVQNGGVSQGENWQVGRDIKRLEKTGQFLRSKLGLREYFPRSLEIMRRGEGARMERSLPLQGRA
ncbi:uncharacterized protein KY384_000230 [Bacidia gigantensis]|uniref:uncharacterized protein n=1 Tax=Bacidia gigantensis TaxID=2732470 RepID=UPI001D0575E2|nr:uncharacterized protein KY384_000230 [Bacidia gigantensis]KAG8526237.1 hypothetical protein KY384_000230 [Bacidia gigantensis]